MGFNKSMNGLVEGRAYPLCVRGGDRGSVAWLCVGTVAREASGLVVTFDAKRELVARALWAACTEAGEATRVEAGALELAFGAQLDHGQVVLVASGVVGPRTERVLRGVEQGARATLSGVGPRAPRSAWPR